MAVGNPTVMIRREDLRQTGFFDSHFVKAEDFELWLRFLANGKVMHNLQENLVYYRIQGNHNEKRGKIHWRNNYLARKRYSRAIWEWNERIFTLSIYFILSHVPDTFVEKLFSLTAVDKMKRIERS
jgi:GT2 family glycosyltransferase